MIGDLEETLENIEEENAGHSGAEGTAETAGAAGTADAAETADASGTDDAAETAGAAGTSEAIDAEETAEAAETSEAGGASDAAETAGEAGTDAAAEEASGAEPGENASASGGSIAGVTGDGSGEESGAGAPMGPLTASSEETGSGDAGMEEDAQEESEDGETGTESYVIGEDGETQVVFDAEPETEYIVSTPASSTLEKTETNTFSKTYHTAAGTIAKTAQSAAKSAAPALKTIGFNIVNAVLIVIIGVQIARLLRKTLNRTFEKIHMDASLREFLSSVIYVLVCGVAGFMALERVGVSSASIVAILGSAGLAVSLSLQDFLANFAGGVIILILKPFRPGDYIVCGTAEGTVLSTSLFYTTLNTIDNRQMILPNGALSNANLINVTAEPKRRLEIRVDISYESDIRTAKEILRRLFDEHPDIMHEEDVVVFVDSLGESGITLVGRGWIAKENYWAAKWKMTEDLKYAFDEAGIVIPYRQVVVHMPDGENGNGGAQK